MDERKNENIRIMIQCGYFDVEGTEVKYDEKKIAQKVKDIGFINLDKKDYEKIKNDTDILAVTLALKTLGKTYKEFLNMMDEESTEVMLRCAFLEEFYNIYSPVYYEDKYHFSPLLLINK